MPHTHTVHRLPRAHTPTVSVVMPVYNVARYVEDAIASVLAQTWLDFELIIVDDGSTDDSLEHCRRFDDHRIRIVQQENRGLAGARNSGIRHARGRYIAFLDSDDLWSEHKLAAHVALLDSRTDVGVSYSQSAFIDDAARPLGYLQAPKLDDITGADVFLRNPVGNGSAPVIRRAALEAVRFTIRVGDELRTCYFDESFRQSEDIECWTRIALQSGWRFAGIDKPLTFYRVNAGGLSAQIENQLASWERFVAKLTDYAPEFAAEHVPLARAFQLRYLARRAVRMGRGALGLRYALRACATEPRLLVREPARTGVTLAAALCASILPAATYRRCELAAMRTATALARLRSNLNADSTRAATGHRRHAPDAATP